MEVSKSVRSYNGYARELAAHCRWYGAEEWGSIWGSYQ
jgi:hypothetical protein